MYVAAAGRGAEALQDAALTARHEDDREPPNAVFIAAP
jgi:hypothetical protein